MKAKKSGTLWVDVTMLVNWSGRMTGIQRVEYNLAKRLATQRDDVRFCVFDKKNGGFIDFNFAHIEFKINNQQEVDHQVPETGNARVSLTKGLKVYAKKGLKRVLPARIKEVAKKRYLSMSSSGHEVIEVANIAKGDGLLILSGDWSDHMFADYVKDLRREYGLRVIQIIYDMLPALFPSYFVVGMPKQFSDYMESILAQCDAVLAISESTKKDVVGFMKEHHMRQIPIDIFRLGDDFVEVTPKQPQHAGLIKGEYILTVCTVEARKNHMLMYYAMREAVVQGVDTPVMVFAGKKGWLVDDLYYLVKNDPVISEKILFIEQPTDSELSWLYQNCQFTVFPSFYEGWGLPVAESLFYGKFCLSSNASSMPEIAGDLIDYFSPNDPIGMLDKIVYYHNDKQTLIKKQREISNSYKMATWDEAYVQVNTLINKVL